MEHMKLNNNPFFKNVSLLSTPLDITMDAHTLSSLLHGSLHLSLLSLVADTLEVGWPVFFPSLGSASMETCLLSQVLFQECRR